LEDCTPWASVLPGLLGLVALRFSSAGDEVEACGAALVVVAAWLGVDAGDLAHETGLGCSPDLPD
jgi:hypothetical protein